MVETDLVMSPCFFFDSPIAMLPERTKRVFQKVLGGNSTNQFLEKLDSIASNMSGVSTLLSTQRLRIRIPSRVERILYNRVTHLILAHVYYLIIAQQRSTAVFNTELTIFLNPNQNFSASNAFHRTMLDVIDLVCQTSEFCFLGPCLVPKLRSWFQPDQVHFSCWGAMHKTEALTKLVSAIRYCVGVPPSRVKEVLLEVAEKIKTMNERIASTHDTGSFGPKPPPLNQRFERENYKRRSTNKRLAMWVSPNSLKNGRSYKRIPATKDKLVAFHGTSMHRDLIAFTDLSIRGRWDGSLVRCPAIISVQPGGASYHLAMDLERSSLFDPANTPTAFVSIINYGSNEKLLLTDLVYSTLHDEGVIGEAKCVVCRRLKKQKRPIPETHGDDEVLGSFLRLLG